MVYEVKEYLLKIIFKDEVRGSIYIHKEYKRWVLHNKEKFTKKSDAIWYIRMCTRVDRKTLNFYITHKYVIQQKAR